MEWSNRELCEYVNCLVLKGDGGNDSELRDLGVQWSRVDNSYDQTHL